ncbi:replicative DNA helicase [Pelosinus propionicus]|uniref:DNA 5'-3' helicase n=1 Tax=Pelosinus propionicus DSM 13327 TaxID=1123291 RepID=A0A1I4N7S3_9FIRM|nr:DnaB-like helicase C-terminal domain-containing protein [Pelosinus propionicus]SFM11561.1 replicative DNA helicase [Pelosinus propionicus DSM 13327]
MIDLELEKNLLGSMCQKEECLIAGMARIKEEYFSDSFNKKVFNLISDMYNNDQHVSVVTVAQEGKAMFTHNSFSWLAIKDSYMPIAAFEHLVDRLISTYQSRKLHSIASKIVSMINEKDDPEEVIKRVEQDLYTVLGDSKLNVITPKDHASRMLDTMYKRIENKHNGGIRTAYGELNKALNGGFEAGQLIIAAAKTGKGKTAFAMNLMRDITIAQKIPGLYINTEMNEEQMDIRWMTMLSQIDHYLIAIGTTTEEQQNKIVSNMNNMHTGGFYSVTEPSLTMNKLISICRRFTAQKKCKFIVVDYIGRMDTLDPKLQEWQVLKVAAKKLKTLAQQLGVTILMLAQVNDEDKLEGSKGMKNECDMYAYLRPLNDTERTEIIGFNYCLDVEKNRSGPTKKIPLSFHGEILTFKGRDING